MMADKNGIRRAKIVCTIGPASRDPETFRLMATAGMDAVRINFSHTSHQQAEDVIELTRAVSGSTGRPLAILADLQGPRIRVGELRGELSIEPDDRVTFVPEGGSDGALGGSTGTAEVAEIPTTYAGLAEDLSPGDRILVDDGRLEFQVESVEVDRVTAMAMAGGTLLPHKGINLPGVEVGAPSLTEKDREDAELALDLGVHYLALSFVRRAADVEALRQVVGDRALIVAKIEKGQALKHLREIMRTADGVMVARGDLGVELEFEEVPVAQKRILRLSQEAVSIGITATQMLESMTRAPRPTRAEVSDVANALLDGTDAVMLSAETAVGAYPVETVAAVDRIIRRVERERGFATAASDYSTAPVDLREDRTVSGAIAGAATEATARLRSPFLVTFTRSGFTARLMAAQRPQVPILAVTDQPGTYGQLALAWGVAPILFEGEATYETLLARARSFAIGQELGEPGQPFVVTAGVPFHVTGTTNYMRIETL